MCGRTVCRRAPDEICRSCRHSTKNGRRAQPKWRDHPGGRQYQPSYNVPPTNHTPILLSKKHFSEGELSECVNLVCEAESAGTTDDLEESDYVVQPMHWGLVPSWHQGETTKTVGLSLNNARSDGLLSKRTFKTPLEKGRRCVVLMDGFYEWQKKEDEKIPYYIYRGAKVLTDEEVDVKVKEEVKTESEDQNPLLMVAGLFDIWKNKEGEPVYSYSVITVDAHKDFSWLHHRMPAILNNEEEIRSWLDFGSVPLNKAVQLLRPVSNLQSHPVSKSVGNVHNKSPDLILPVDPKKVKPKPSASSNFMSAWLKKSDKSQQKEKNAASLTKSEVKEEIKVSTQIKAEARNDPGPCIPAKKPKLE